MSDGHPQKQHRSVQPGEHEDTAPHTVHWSREESPHTSCLGEYSSLGDTQGDSSGTCTPSVTARAPVALGQGGGTGGHSKHVSLYTRKTHQKGNSVINEHCPGLWCHQDTALVSPERPGDLVICEKAVSPQIFIYSTCTQNIHRAAYVYFLCFPVCTLYHRL